MNETITHHTPDAVQWAIGAYRGRCEAAAQARASAEQIAALIPAAEKEVQTAGQELQAAEQTVQTREKQLRAAEGTLKEIRDGFAAYGRALADAEKNAGLLLQMARHICTELGIPMPDLGAQTPPTHTHVPLPDVGAHVCYVGSTAVHLRQVFFDRKHCGWRWLGTLVPGLNGGQVPQMHRTDDDNVHAAFDFIDESYGPLKPISPCREDPPRCGACTGDLCEHECHSAAAQAYAEETERVAEILGQPDTLVDPPAGSGGEAPNGPFQPGDGRA